MKLVFEVAKMSRDVRDLRRRIECSSSPHQTATQDATVVPELVDGPLDDVNFELLSRLREKSAQSYVVSVYITCLNVMSNILKIFIQPYVV